MAAREWVAVFAIAAFLAAMVLPVFSRAADRARQAVHLGNIGTSLCKALKRTVMHGLHDSARPPSLSAAVR
jgi:hypothetical protein